MAVSRGRHLKEGYNGLGRDDDVFGQRDEFLVEGTESWNEGG